MDGYASLRDALQRSPDVRVIASCFKDEHLYDDEAKKAFDTTTDRAAFLKLLQEHNTAYSFLVDFFERHGILVEEGPSPMAFRKHQSGASPAGGGHCAQALGTILGGLRHAVAFNCQTVVRNLIRMNLSDDPRLAATTRRNAEKMDSIAAQLVEKLKKSNHPLDGGLELSTLGTDGIGSASSSHHLGPAAQRLLNEERSLQRGRDVVAYSSPSRARNKGGKFGAMSMQQQQQQPRSPSNAANSSLLLSPLNSDDRSFSVQQQQEQQQQTDENLSPDAARKLSMRASFGRNSIHAAAAAAATNTTNNNLEEGFLPRSEFGGRRSTQDVLDQSRSPRAVYRAPECEERLQQEQQQEQEDKQNPQHQHAAPKKSTVGGKRSNVTSAAAAETKKKKKIQQQQPGQQQQDQFPCSDESVLRQRAARLAGPVTVDDAGNVFSPPSHRLRVLTQREQEIRAREDLLLRKQRIREGTEPNHYYEDLFARPLPNTDAAREYHAKQRRAARTLYLRSPPYFLILFFACAVGVWWMQPEDGLGYGTEEKVLILFGVLSFAAMTIMWPDLIFVDLRHSGRDGATEDPYVVDLRWRLEMDRKRAKMARLDEIHGQRRQMIEEEYVRALKPVHQMYQPASLHHQNGQQQEQYYGQQPHYPQQQQQQQGPPQQYGNYYNNQNQQQQQQQNIQRNQNQPVGAVNNNAVGVAANQRPFQRYPTNSSASSSNNNNNVAVGGGGGRPPIAPSSQTGRSHPPMQF